MSDAVFLICLAIYCALFLALYVWQIITARREQRRRIKSDKRRIAEIERQWRKMDEQPREKSGRFTFKHKEARLRALLAEERQHAEDLKAHRP